MLKEYPEYARGDLEIVFAKLQKGEQKIIKDFIEYCSIGAGEHKVEDMRRSIIQFRDITQTNFDSIDLEILRKYLAVLNKSDRTKYTKNGIKTHIKKFLRWKFKNWSERFDSLKDIRTQRAFNEEKINANTLLKKEEIEKIMKAENRLFWKTLFITLYESGLRPIELKNLKWKDINFNVEGDITELNIFATKTSKARVVYVKEATHYLQRLKEEAKDSGILVFPSPRDENKLISKGSVEHWLKTISKKAIGRQIFPYLLRHTRATELYLNAKIPQKVAQKFLGHTKDMSDLYSHLSSKDVKEAMAKSVYQLEELPPETKHELEKRVELLEKTLQKLIEANKKVLKKSN